MKARRRYNKNPAPHHPQPSTLTTTHNSQHSLLDTSLLNVDNMVRTLITLIFFCAVIQVTSLASKSPKFQHTEPLSRRNALFTGAATLATATASLIPATSTQPAWAADIDSLLNAANKASFPPEKIELLQKIVAKASDEEVLAAISKLELLDPSQGKAATSDQLGGTWELIYSINTDSFSPLLNLPQPIRPESIQLLGDDAAQVVGLNRAAQLLNFPIVPLTFILSSGAVPVETDPSMIEIFPPFRFDVKFGGFRTQVLEAGSDAGFRALNARDEEAQAAPRNMYKQRYLETTGKKGDLRISEVVSGDPVIVVSQSVIHYYCTCLSCGCQV